MPKENIVEYFYNKRSELVSLRFRDILLAKAIADIHRYYRNNRFDRKEKIMIEDEIYRLTERKKYFGV